MPAKPNQPSSTVHEVAEGGTPAAQTRIVFFGDSICHGQFVSPHLTWVSRVAEAFGERALVMNPSVSGNTTRQALERMPYDVQAHFPDILVVQFGMNDCNRWDTDKGLPRVSELAFAANLHEIVERARLFGARAVILHTNHRAIRSPAYAIWNARYNEIIRDVALETGALLTDLERAGDYVDPATLLLPDGVHLNANGHDFYYRTVRPRIEALL